MGLSLSLGLDPSQGHGSLCSTAPPPHTPPALLTAVPGDGATLFVLENAAFTEQLRGRWDLVPPFPTLENYMNFHIVSGRIDVSNVGEDRRFQRRRQNFDVNSRILTSKPQNFA